MCGHKTGTLKGEAFNRNAFRQEGVISLRSCARLFHQMFLDRRGAKKKMTIDSALIS